MFINFYTLSSYFPILVFLCLALIISTALLGIPFILNNRTKEKAKLEPYECGSDPIGKGRNIFDARFYLVAMLFIIFDLEIVFIFPWAVSLGSTSYIGFWLAMIFLFILGLGFIYEWKKGALEWE
jgi:NADH-quinone oxidoreductase subunit A